MKRVLKSPEPQSLADFRAARPDAKWDEMRNDGEHYGLTAYEDCRAQIMEDQHHLCAYCECKLDAATPHKCRVEHFHPKSDRISGHNWDLDWQNLLATCNGGESEGSPDTPLPDNLSCDAHKKDAVIAVNPLNLPAFPNVFSFDKSTGCLVPDLETCAEASVDADKLKQALAILNLNCLRLTRQRHSVFVAIERRKKTLREKRYTPKEGLAALAHSYFDGKWPEFFTTIRCCLGQAAEDYLHSSKYNG